MEVVAGELSPLPAIRYTPTEKKLLQSGFNSICQYIN